MSQDSAHAKHAATRRGLSAALGAYSLWGLMPFFMKAVADVPVAEVVAHRIIWSVPVAGLILILMGRTKDLQAALKNPRMIAMAAVTAFCVTANWTVYTWAIIHEQTVESALGYYINPLFNVLLGVVFLKEKLTRVQWFSVGLAALAVIILTIATGGLPWVAILLPVSFGLYGFFRKKLPIGPTQGFMLEALILFIPALVVGFVFSTPSHFIDGSWSDRLLLMLGGVMTAVPLVLFATGAKYLSLATLGITQYLTPTFVFLVAIFVFHEPFSYVQLIAFALIWIALVLYTVSSLRAYHKQSKRG